MTKALFAQAALNSIQEHIANNVGTRPFAQWDDHDVTDIGIMSRALGDQGLPNEDEDTEKLEDVVSPLVFWQYHGATPAEALESNTVQNALQALAEGGLTYEIPALAP